MAYQPIATEFSAIYTLTGPDGTVAVFNDPTSGNYVGALTEISGLDSSDIRESATDAVEADGGAHGSFYMGRRPVVITGRVFNHASVTERTARLDRARRASMALRGDSQLKWTPTGAQEVFLNLRRQQPFRESGGWVKDFQIPMVAANPIIQSTTQVSVSGGSGTTQENQGNWPAYPIVQISGTSTNPTITDGTRTFATTGLTIASGETVQFDFLTHTGTFIAGARNGQSANRYIDFTATTWPYLTGAGTSQTFTRGGSGAWTLIYRHTWA